MKKIRHYLEYKILLGIGFLIRGLPRSTMLQLGRLVGDFIYYCVPVRKSIVFNHLEFSFPDKSAAERKIIARGAYQNFGMNVFEHLCVPMLSNEDFRRIVKLVDEDVLVIFRIVDRELGHHGRIAVVESLPPGRCGHTTYPSNRAYSCKANRSVIPAT